MEKLNGWEWGVITLLVAIILTLIFGTWLADVKEQLKECEQELQQLNQSCQEQRCELCQLEKCESCMLYNPEVEHGLKGIYFADKYYCVWTDGKNASQIENTDNHEACHYLTDKDEEHFCGGESLKPVRNYLNY